MKMHETSRSFRQGTQLQSCYLNDIKFWDTEKYEWAESEFLELLLCRYGHAQHQLDLTIYLFPFGDGVYKFWSEDNKTFIPPADIDYFYCFGYR